MAKPKPIQFLDAKPRAEAERLWHGVLALQALPSEEVAMERVLGRVLASDVRAAIDVPPFDRAIVDGYAVVASDTFAATEVEPVALGLIGAAILAGVAPTVEVVTGTCVEIATGGVLPRGANAVQMVERTDRDGDVIRMDKALVPGAGVQACGSDLRVGDRVLLKGQRVSSRESGVLASLGLSSVACVRRPRVAVLSTGDELRPPGSALSLGAIYDANSRVVCDALTENGAEPVFLGIIPDDEERLRAALQSSTGFDAIVLSGGTSKGSGDLTFHLIDELGSPGIVVHGVQVKPGKPIVLASWSGKPVVVLPGFPTSALLTFNLFVRPVIRRLGGLTPQEPQAVLDARIPKRLHSASGRYEYVMVNLVRDGEDYVAHPVPKGSGSISAFADADGYLEIPESRDVLLEGERARVTLFSVDVRPADLLFIGSHCQGIDRLFERLREEQGVSTKILNVGSTGGVAAVFRGEADLAGVHLLDRDGRYNFEAQREAGDAVLIRGYRRRQGILYRAGDFDHAPTLREILERPRLRMINRPRGAGTRVLFDRELEAIATGLGLSFAELRARVSGYDRDARSHGAVAAAIRGGVADWGLGIEAAALQNGLCFAPLQAENFDLLIPRSRLERAPVRAALAMLRGEAFAADLSLLGGFERSDDIGTIVWSSET